MIQYQYMKIFVCEFITGGGLTGVELPEVMAKEGDLMLHSIIRDLLDAGCRDLLTTRDSRLANLEADIECMSIDGPAWECWKKILQDADAALFIAPETDAALYTLTTMAESLDCHLLCCDSRSVAITSSKQRCAKQLREHDINVPDSYSLHTLNKNRDQALVVKPDNGAGAENIFLFAHTDDVHTWLNDRPDMDNWIIQSHIAGAPASMTLLCGNDKTIILSVNRQMFEFNNGQGEFTGVMVNEFADRARELVPLADAIIQAIPGLQGFVGVDFVFSDNGPVVIEINPRLTTAYAGLRASLGYNPADLLLQFPGKGDFPDLYTMKPTPVSIRLDSH